MQKNNFVPILIASSNNHKIKEIKDIIPSIDFLSPEDLQLQCDVEETGSTFLENALIKARAYFNEVNKIRIDTYKFVSVLAEDSGLCVEALDDGPGIYSARYALNLPEARNNKDPLFQCKKILAELGNNKNRKALFVCSAVFMYSLSDIFSFQATWRGNIIEGPPRGSGGFGYDPIFYLSKYNCTAAELSPKQKNTLSHRAQALRGIASYLNIAVS